MHVFNSAYRQHCNGWASQFPFLDGLKNVDPSSEACLCGRINRSWHRLSNFPQLACLSHFLLREVANPRSWTGSHFSVQKGPVLECSGASLAKRSHLESRIETHLGGKKCAGSSACASSAAVRKKGGLRD